MTRAVSIVASHPHKRKIGSDLIMWELGTDYSHVSWIFWSKDLKTPFYYESTMHGGVTFTGQEHWEARNRAVFLRHFELSEDEYDEFLELAMSRCGEEYGFWQNLGIKINNLLKLGYNIFGNGGELANCSELIFDFAHLVRLEIGIRNPDLVTPYDIVEACKARA